MATAEKTQYNEFAGQYANAAEVPFSKIEADLVGQAMGRVTGLTILDLGGGNGVHARRAIDAGGALVDVVDISSGMLRAGEEIEKKLGRQGRIRWFEGDATRPLAEQITASGNDGLRAEGYDLVMANWLFDHATNLADLEGMWANVVSYLKPGGRFLGIRMLDPYTASKSPSSAKYGFTFSDVEAIPNGWKYTVECWTQPPFSFEATSMQSTYTLADDIPRRLGLVDFTTVDPRETPLVKSDSQFWEDFVKEPSCTVVLARKPSSQG